MKRSHDGGIGVGAQAWGLAKKLREVDDLMSPEKQVLIYEVHPELSFREMAGHHLQHSKKSSAGKSERINLLLDAGFPDLFLDRGRTDDFFDACAALWTAERIYRGEAKRIPPIIERDPRGLDMAIWY